MGSICECDELKYGYFICPICQKKSGYDKWQRKGDKWIFYRDNAWYASHEGTPYEFAEDCWKNTGGGSAQQWNTINWVCYVCRYPSNFFYDYIPNYQGTNEYKLSLEKRKNDFLTKELVNNKIDNMLLNKEANLYSFALLKQQEEINNLNSQIQDMEDGLNEDLYSQ